jgi:hypothetical protein
MVEKQKGKLRGREKRAKGSDLLYQQLTPMRTDPISPKHIDPFMRAVPPYPSPLPKALPPNTAPMAVKVQQEFCW